MTPYVPKPDSRSVTPFFTGWRKSGLINAILIWILTLLLTALLFTSAFRLGDGWSSFLDNTKVPTGNCEEASHTNLALHVILNAVATLALASSNFFMQVFCAPSRDNIDKAHQKGRCLEIGVQSVKNLRYLSAPRIVSWLLLGATSVPLHLFINASVTETRATTDFQVVLAADDFLKGGPYAGPGVGRPFDANLISDKLLGELAANASTPGWDELDFEKCKGEYDDPLKPMSTRRHLIMILRDKGKENVTSTGWNQSQLLNLSNEESNEESSMYLWTYYTPLFNTTNALWLTSYIEGTANGINNRRERINVNSTEEQDKPLFTYLGIRPDGTLDSKNLGIYTGELAPVLKVDRCISELYKGPCEVQFQNNILLVVCIFTLAKSIICTGLLLRFRHENPLITPGDAIESFISKPDPTTKDMCWMSHRPGRYPQSRMLSFLRVPWRFSSGPWLSGARRWNPLQWRRRMGSAIPWEIWIFSYFCIGAMLGIGIVHLKWYWDGMPL